MVMTNKELVLVINVDVGDLFADDIVSIAPSANNLQWRT